MGELITKYNELTLVIAIVMGFTSYTLWHMGLKRYNSTGA